MLEQRTMDERNGQDYHRQGHEWHLGERRTRHELRLSCNGGGKSEDRQRPDEGAFEGEGAVESLPFDCPRRECTQQQERTPHRGVPQALGAHAAAIIS
jgi:hypothetical protein